MTDRLVDRKPRPRLKDFNYRGEYAYHVTLRTANSTKVFRDPTLANSVVGLLKSSAEACQFKVLAYCLMPDHVHLLVQGENEAADLKRLVSVFKQRTGFAYKQQTQDQLWQVSYFDRVLRRDESLQSVADYIFYNPVKEGLALAASGYPLSGGTYFTDKRIAAPTQDGDASARGDRAEAAVPTSAKPSLPTPRSLNHLPEET